MFPKLCSGSEKNKHETPAEAPRERERENLDVRAQMIMPSFPTLLANPTNQVLSDIRPFRDAMLLHQSNQQTAT